MYWGVDFRVDFAVGACVDFVRGEVENWMGMGGGAVSIGSERGRFDVMILYLAGVKKGHFSFCLDMLTLSQLTHPVSDKTNSRKRVITCLLVSVSTSRR